MKLSVTPECYHTYIATEGNRSILTITPNCYYELLAEFTEYLRPKIPKIKYVYGIPKGGVSVAQYLAYNLNLKLITNLTDPNIVDHFTLIADDVIEGGQTLDWYIRLFPECTTAVLHRKPVEKRIVYKDPEYISRYGPIEKTKLDPDFYLHDMDDIWIRYPYEPKDDPINR